MHVNKRDMLETLETTAKAAWERVGNTTPGDEEHTGALKEAEKSTELYLKFAESIEHYDNEVESIERNSIIAERNAQIEEKKMRNNLWTNIGNFAVPALVSAGLGLVFMGIDVDSTMTTSLGKSVAGKVWDVLKLAHGNLKN